MQSIINAPPDMQVNRTQASATQVLARVADTVGDFIGATTEKAPRWPTWETILHEVKRRNIVMKLQPGLGFDGQETSAALEKLRDTMQSFGHYILEHTPAVAWRFGSLQSPKTRGVKALIVCLCSLCTLMVRSRLPSTDLSGW